MLYLLCLVFLTRATSIIASFASSKCSLQFMRSAFLLSIFTIFQFVFVGIVFPPSSGSLSVAAAQKKHELPLFESYDFKRKRVTTVPKIIMNENNAVFFLTTKESPDVSREELQFIPHENSYNHDGKYQQKIHNFLW